MQTSILESVNVITNGRCAQPFFRQAYATQTDTNYSFEDDYMLVTFTTKAYADITMFGNVALTLLKMMGHSGTVPSAILTADGPAVLNRLTAAINAGKHT